MTANGAFDTVFEPRGARARSAIMTAPSPRRARTVRCTDNGGYVYGGYRVSRGSFPVYEDQNYTNRLGE